MSDDSSKRDANAKSEKPLPEPQQPHKGARESAIETEEITPYRDRPSRDGKYGDAADEPASGYPNAAPEPDGGKSK